MREIKFRAWNTVTKTMIDLKKLTPLALNMDTDGLFIPFSDGLPLMQFTGLKDRNGTEIYEGDIVRHDAVLYAEVGSVAFCEGAYELIHLDGDFLCHLWSDVEERFEVIGNIYENEAQI